MERHASPERVADHVRLLEPKLVDEAGDVVRHQPDVEWPIDVSRTAMALQVDCDDLVPLRELRQNRRVHIARPESAVQENHRPPGAVRLVVEIETVELGVLPGALRISCPIGGHVQAPNVNWKSNAGVETRPVPEIHRCSGRQPAGGLGL